MSERESEWFAVAMNAAAYLEDAANCIRGDAEAKKAALGAAKHVSEKCNQIWSERRAQPAQAVPQLTDDEIDSVWDAIPQNQFWWRRYARAIEQIVRAKQAPPIPAEQIQKLRHLIDWTDSESYLTFARAIEAAHGIVGKGGA